MNLENRNIEHFKLELVPQSTEESTSICMQAIRSCCGCGVVISSVNGGGSYICKPCADVLHFGLMNREFMDAHKLLQEKSNENQQS